MEFAVLMVTALMISRLQVLHLFQVVRLLKQKIKPSHLAILVAALVVVIQVLIIKGLQRKAATALKPLYTI